MFFPIFFVIFSHFFHGKVYSRHACDQLVPEHCLLPFPNDFYTEILSVENENANENGEKHAKTTGKRVNLTAADLMFDRVGRGIDPAEWNLLDGFSASGTIITYFPMEPNVTNSPVPGWKNVHDSLDLAWTATIVVDTITGEIVPHWAEIDYSTQEPHDRRAFLIQPAVRLNDATRYVVAIRRLVTTDFAAVQPSAGFLALRDNLPSDDPDIESRRSHFNNDIFPILESKGFSRSSLQIAWDFTTASLGCVTNRAVFARDDALSRIPASGPNFRITEVIDEYSANYFRLVRGVVEVPFYMDSPEPYSKLVVDPITDVPIFQYMHEVEFSFAIPRSVWENPYPRRLVQYGHGLLYSQDEIYIGWLQGVANEYEWVLIASDWLGMSEEDEPAIIQMMMTDISDFYIVPDRSIQGFIAKIVIMKAAMSEAFLDHEVFTKNGTRLINIADRVFLGRSQGSVLGGSLVALHPFVSRATFGVGGNSYAILLPRAVGFVEFFEILKTRYSDPLDLICFVGGLANMLWDRGEGSGYSHVTTRNPLPGTPVKQILMQYSLHDSQVTFLGTYVYARSLGNAVMFESNVLEGEPAEVMFGFPFVPDNNVVYGNSVLVGWDAGKPPVPILNIPPNEDDDTHDFTRSSVNGQIMQEEFFNTGGIRNTCGGSCYQ